MSVNSGLTVRQHERADVSLRIEFILAEPHRGQVRFSSSSNALDPRTLRGTAFDVSPGGMGISFGQFVPRMCEGAVRVLAPGADEAAADREIVFEHDVKVRRVYLRGPEPTYAVGVSFVDPEPGLDGRVQKMLLNFARYRAETEAREDGAHA